MKRIFAVLIIGVVFLTAPQFAAATALVSESFSGYTTGNLAGQNATGTGLIGAWSGSFEFNAIGTGLTPGAGGAAQTSAAGIITAMINGSLDNVFYFSFEAYREPNDTREVEFMGTTMQRYCINNTGIELRLTATDGSYVSVGINIDGSTAGTGTYRASMNSTAMMAGGVYTTDSVNGGIYTNASTELIVGKYNQSTQLLQLFAVAPTAPGATEPTSALLSLTPSNHYTAGTFGVFNSIQLWNSGLAMGVLTATADELRVGSTWADVASYTPTRLPGDVDDNKVVNGNDLNIILSNYGTKIGMTWATGATGS